jgi:prophage regulatory protein
MERIKMHTEKKPHAQHEVSKRAFDNSQKSQELQSNSFDDTDELHCREKLRLLRRPEVEARTGIARSTLYEWMKRGEFPQPVKLGTRLVAWRESDITAWLESRETRGV